MGIEPREKPPRDDLVVHFSAEDPSVTRKPPRESTAGGQIETQRDRESESFYAR
jgi:hypothetical protein